VGNSDCLILEQLKNPTDNSKWVHKIAASGKHILGRDEGGVIPIISEQNSAFVSARHATLTFHDNSFYLVDGVREQDSIECSRYGTYLRRDKISLTK
jgi:pSer/pThr/pTyr-binding forkhead associated (FHA) protein